MPGTREFRRALLDYCIGARRAVNAVACGLALLAREYALAEVAMAKSGLFRQRHAELRALYLESQREPEIGGGPRQPLRDPASRNQNRSNLSWVTAGRTR
jgi:hypothetical protein